MSEIKDYFDGITTAKSADDIVKSVMERAAKRPERSRLRSKPLAVAAAAAVVLVGATVGVGAANDWNYSQAFKALFEANQERTYGETIVEPVDFNYDGYTKSLDVQYEYKGHTIDVKWVASDGVAAVFLYEIECGSQEELDELHLGFNATIDEDISYSHTNISPIFDGGKAIGSTRIILEEDNLIGKTVDFNIYTDDDGYTVSVLIDFIATADCITLNEGNYGSFLDGEGNISEIRISPMSMMYKLSDWTNMSGIGRYDRGYKLKNGNYIDTWQYWSGNQVKSDGDESVYLIVFDYPIDIDEISAIVLGDTTVELK